MIDFFHVIEPGAYTTVQDSGRFGFQRFGVPPTGMLDPYAGRIAGMLVGNDEDEALLELTFAGCILAVLAPGEIALTGAAMPLTINGAPKERWRSHSVLPGDTVRIGQAQSGCRAYLAIGGGIDVPKVMGSRSCYTGAGIGGHEGRPLAAGDVLPRGSKEVYGRSRKLPATFVPEYGGEIVLRAVAGPQSDYFDEGLKGFFDSAYTVTPQANRMGYRLAGPPVNPKPEMPKSIISEPSLPGGVQVPADGQPIILLVEQTVGGYTKVATVITTDIAKVAQAVPGDRIRFEPVSLAAAHGIYRRHCQMMARVKSAVDEGKVSWAGYDAAAERENGIFSPVIFNPEMLFDRIESHLCQI